MIAGLQERLSRLGVCVRARVRVVCVCSVCERACVCVVTVCVCARARVRVVCVRVCVQRGCVLCICTREYMHACVRECMYVRARA